MGLEEYCFMLSEGLDATDRCLFCSRPPWPRVRFRSTGSMQSLCQSSKTDQHHVCLTTVLFL